MTQTRTVTKDVEGLIKNGEMQICSNARFFEMNLSDLQPRLPDHVTLDDWNLAAKSNGKYIEFLANAKRTSATPARGAQPQNPAAPTPAAPLQQQNQATPTSKQQNQTAPSSESKHQDAFSSQPQRFTRSNAPHELRMKTKLWAGFVMLFILACTQYWYPILWSFNNHLLFSHFTNATNSPTNSSNTTDASNVTNTSNSTTVLSPWPTYLGFNTTWTATTSVEQANPSDSFAWSFFTTHFATFLTWLEIAVCSYMIMWYFFGIHEIVQNCSRIVQNCFGVKVADNVPLRGNDDTIFVSAGQVAAQEKKEEQNEAAQDNKVAAQDGKGAGTDAAQYVLEKIKQENAKLLKSNQKLKEKNDELQKSSSTFVSFLEKLEVMLAAAAIFSSFYYKEELGIFFTAFYVTVWLVVILAYFTNAGIQGFFGRLMVYQTAGLICLFSSITFIVKDETCYHTDNALWYLAIVIVVFVVVRCIMSLMTLFSLATDEGWKPMSFVGCLIVFLLLGYITWCLYDIKDYWSEQGSQKCRESFSPFHALELLEKWNNGRLQKHLGEFFVSLTQQDEPTKSTP